MTNKNLRIELVCIGTELLTGKQNTHTALIGRRLLEEGFRLAGDHTVADDPAAMKKVFERLWKTSEVIISAGGLGPTFDDITRDVWSRVTKRKLRRDAALLREVLDKFQKRGIRMPPMNNRQADLLKGAHAIPNSNGTAPGQILETEKKLLVLLPGPARELIPMLEKTVIPELHRKYKTPLTFNKTFLMAGVPESKIDELIRPLIRRYGRVKGGEVVYGILASQSIISVKACIQATNQSDLDRACALIIPKFRKKLSPYIFGEDDDTLPSALGRLLNQRKKTVAAAESCTGGWVGKLITDAPGASNYFKGGIIAYSNELKATQLGVRRETLKEYGAVSLQTAKEMARSVRQKTGADFGIGTTGIAGPAGGSPGKPVGLVYIALADSRRALVQKYLLSGDREGIRKRAALIALELLRRHLCRVTPSIF